MESDIALEFIDFHNRKKEKTAKGVEHIVFDIAGVHEPKSLNRALRLLSEDEKMLIIAGGTDVLIGVRAGKFKGRTLLSIRDLPELSGICLDDRGNLEIGALTTLSQLEEHPLITRHVPVLASAAGSVGGPQIRTMGTIGGNLCNGVTSADTASVAHALEAELVLLSEGGERRVPVGEFQTGPGRTSRKANELLSKIVITREAYEGMGGCYIKYAMREAMDIATLGCAALVKASKDHETIEKNPHRIWCGGAHGDARLASGEGAYRDAPKGRARGHCQ